LKELRLPVVLMKDEWAICVHTQHTASTSGECKIITGKLPERVMYGPLVASLPFYEWCTRALCQQEEAGRGADRRHLTGGSVCTARSRAQAGR